MRQSADDGVHSRSNRIAMKDRFGMSAGSALSHQWQAQRKMRLYREAGRAFLLLSQSSTPVTNDNGSSSPLKNTMT
jgi:hypothetical protein